MRALIVGAMVLTVGCSGPTGAVSSAASPTPSATSPVSPSPSPGPSPVVGGVVEYPVGAPDASLSGMTAGRDGNLWFVDVGVNKVGRITPSGVTTEFAVPGSVGGPETITAGPDGNVWMVASGAGGVASSSILRINPTGIVKVFPVPGGGPDGITTGPDGNLWFTEIFHGAIGQMTPDGRLIRVFPVPGSNPRGIVAGPDGNLWFADSSPQHNAIGRMTPSGAVTEYTLTTGEDRQVTPTAIAVGPDHNIWFTEINGAKIGRITPAGDITEFPLPDGGFSQGLTTGPDGNVWFTARGGSQGGVVGRITPGGTIRLFSVPGRNSWPIGIAAGPDGRIWFTDGDVHRVGSIGETVPEVRLGSSLLSFGTTLARATRSITVTSTGDAGLIPSSVKIIGADHAAFTVTGDTCTGRTVAAGATCQVAVTFAPGSDHGVLTAQVELTDNATGSPRFVSLVAQLPDCRLPVFTPSGAVMQGGFLDLRSGIVEPDTGGLFQLDQAQGLYRSKAVPTLVGSYPGYYDSVARRWLPTNSASVSPDQTRYAYVATVGSITDRALHVVDVATGLNRTLKLPSGVWSVLAFTKDGIYLHVGYEGIGPGLTLVDPDTGVVRTVFSDSSVFQVGEGAAWVGAQNGKDPLPAPPGIGNGFNEVLRRDLATGQTALWLYESGSNLSVVGVGGSRALISGFFLHGSGTWMVSGAGKAERLMVPGTGEDLSYNGGFVSDAQGVWLTGLDGIYLWRAGAGLTLVSAAPATPAGSCL